MVIFDQTTGKLGEVRAGVPTSDGPCSFLCYCNCKCLKDKQSTTFKDLDDLLKTS